MVDLVVVSCNRLDFTRQCIDHLFSRTDTAIRIIAVDNGSRDGSVDYLAGCDAVDVLIALDENRGIHHAKNAGLAMVTSTPYYVDTDNDVLAASMQPDWLAWLIALMDCHPDYGSIACRPQVLVGEGPDEFDNCEEIREMRHIGAWLRIMRTEAVKAVGGWRLDAPPGRNNEDQWIAGKLREAGYKTGCARDVRCWHLFGVNWGYPDWVDHGHKPMFPPPEHWDTLAVDPNTWEPLT